MSEIIKTIKDLSHKVSEDYLLFGNDMNSSLMEMVQKGEIENIEVLKRVCENANSNVYLSLFHDKEVDNSNIIFDLADFNKISMNAKKSEEAMKGYNTPPDDFRSALELVITPVVESGDNEKISELNEAVEYRQVFRNFLNKVEIMKTAESQIANDSFNAMANDAKIMISKGESIGDISKIATRYVKDDLEGDFVKVAKSYDIIHKELTKSGFNVKTNFTKFSSQRINNKSQMIQPVHDFANSIAKVAGLIEMEENIRKTLDAFDKVVTEEIK